MSPLFGFNFESNQVRLVQNPDHALFRTLYVWNGVQVKTQQKGVALSQHSATHTALHVSEPSYIT
eukprot:2686009-Amphidinium_carterae.1